MKNILMLSILVWLLCYPIGVARSNEIPVNSNETYHSNGINQSSPKGFIARTTLLQLKLKQKMSGLIRDVKKEGRIAPLIVLVGIAFAYGVLHAAGPGHGKLIATSYVLSHQCTLARGLIIAVLIALVHGISGIIGVLGLRLIIQSSFNENLTTVTTVTQCVSYGLIALLGLGILIQHARSAFFIPDNKADPNTPKGTSKGLVPWILAAGLVPCPAVVMVMFFCLSMDVTALGLFLAICVQLGMALTISAVITMAVMGKVGTFRAVSRSKASKLEAYVGMGSGAVAMLLGLLFLVTSVPATLH